MTWIQNNFRKIVYVAFLVPILTVAFVSISHVTQWYNISNPTSWAAYLSIGIEIAALSALAAISVQMGKKVYFPFGLVTLIQFIGNIFFAYQYIDVNSQLFKDWITLCDPLVSSLGVESMDIIGHRRFLALFSGGLLPLISLSFLHMLVKFEEEDKIIPVSQELPVNIDEISIAAGKMENENSVTPWQPTEEEFKQFEELFKKHYLNNSKDEVIVIEENVAEDSKDEDLVVNITQETIDVVKEDEILDNIIEEPIDVIIPPKEIENNIGPKINRLSYTKKNA